MIDVLACTGVLVDFANIILRKNLTTFIKSFALSIFAYVADIACVLARGQALECVELSESGLKRIIVLFRRRRVVAAVARLLIVQELLADCRLACDETIVHETFWCNRSDFISG